MIRTFTLEPGQPLTNEQFREIEEARKHPIVFDTDCEELSPAMMNTFKSTAIHQGHRRKTNPKKAVLLIRLQASGKSTSYREGFDRPYYVKLEQDRFLIEEWKETL